MAFTVSHLRTLSLEDLETLQRLHGDTLTEQEKKNLEKVITEKREGDGETTSEQENESGGERETPPPTPANESGNGEVPPWYKEPASADEVADKLLERFAEAERIADQAAGEGEGSEGDSSVGGSSESKTEEEKKTESEKTQTTEQSTSTDEAPEQEHWFYRGRKKKVKSES